MFETGKRVNDEYNEEYMRPILDKIYKVFNFSVERVNDKYRQIHGIDVILTKGNHQFIVDEKCDFSRTLNIDNSREDRCTTFAFELYRKQRNQEWDYGWFYPSIRKNLKNDSYMLFWIEALKNSGKIYQVKEVELCFVSYDAVKNWIDYPRIFDYEKIVAACETKRKHLYSLHGEQYYKELGKVIRIDDFNHEYPHIHRLTYSPILRECPLNVLLKKSDLRKICIGDYGFRFVGSNGNETPIAMKELHAVNKPYFNVWKTLRDDTIERLTAV